MSSSVAISDFNNSDKQNLQLFAKRRRPQNIKANYFKCLFFLPIHYFRKYEKKLITAQLNSKLLLRCIKSRPFPK